ncbi:F5/8 type C domain-containing protein [Paenibacillus sp. cl141a]|uniref:discoidin domain-containing protein n=1 Tax=Paenibacillus sp. cl141a TaxID=1761877 RepID=UPI0008AEF54F|nr:discoidin domain-containing protein [Paenibacillus sp. cl141a]SEL81302.1 F5/8 type C domain-containing protein [Paenibacillus sp. cl141a]
MAYLNKDNAIPLMTSDTTPSGISTASSAASAAWNAFTNSTNDWRTVAGQLSGWIRYDFPRAVAIGQYTIVPFGGTGGVGVNPKSWTFEGSNDGVNWTMLDNRNNQTVWTAAVICTIPNNTRYLKYRLNISENNGHASWVGIRQLMMFERVFEQKYLVSSAGNYYSIKMPDSEENVITPVKSNAESIGIVNHSTISTTGWEAFDGNKTGNGWLINLRSEAKTQWLSYRFPTPKVISKYTISFAHTSVDTAPKSWTFEGSNDANNWTILDTRTDETNWAQYSTREYVFYNKKAYMYYRIYVSENNGGLYQIYISEIEMMQTNSTTIDLVTQAPNEDDFIKFGIDKATIIDLDRTLDTKSFLDKNGTNLGTGKVFKRTIDTNSVKIKRVMID